jgi:DnaJ-class molecular chaperone
LATQAKRDYHEVLGVARDAAAPEVQAAFQRLASAFHAAGRPKNIGDVEEIRNYVRAYRVLSDAKKRGFYDRTGFAPPETELAGSMKPVADGESVGHSVATVKEILDWAGIAFEVLSS